MIAGRRLIVVTPAGRKRYLEILAKHVLRCSEVDEWHLWANTSDQDDLNWMVDLRKRETRVLVVYPTWPHEGNYSIHRYFPGAAEPNTVYIRLDDDIVWCDRAAIRTLAERRCADPGPFLMYGNVLNTGITSHLHQRARRLTKDHGFVGYACMDPVGWGNGKFAVDLHREFLRQKFDLMFSGEETRKAWRLADWELSLYERHSINVTSWLGEDCARWCREMGRDEEQWLSHERPKQEGRPNLIVGNALYSHYSFYSQREVVDRHPDILDGYRKLVEIV